MWIHAAASRRGAGRRRTTRALASRGPTALARRVSTSVGELRRVRVARRTAASSTVSGRCVRPLRLAQGAAPSAAPRRRAESDQELETDDRANSGHASSSGVDRSNVASAVARLADRHPPVADHRALAFVREAARALLLGAERSAARASDGSAAPRRADRNAPHVGRSRRSRTSRATATRLQTSSSGSAGSAAARRVPRSCSVKCGSCRPLCDLVGVDRACGCSPSEDASESQVTGSTSSTSARVEAGVVRSGGSRRGSSR